jgi:hypothetical protein
VMDNPPTTPIQPTTVPAGMRKPLVVFALPFVVGLVTFWFLCRYLPAHTPVAGTKITREGLQVEWEGLWMVAFLPFAAICFISSVVMFAQRARYSFSAKVALFPAAGFLLFVLAEIGFIVYQIVSQ